MNIKNNSSDKNTLKNLNFLKFSIKPKPSRFSLQTIRWGLWQVF